MNLIKYVICCGQGQAHVVVCTVSFATAFGCLSLTMQLLLFRKNHARFACSVVNALTTAHCRYQLLRILYNFSRELSYFINNPTAAASRRPTVWDIKFNSCFRPIFEGAVVFRRKMTGGFLRNHIKSILQSLRLTFVRHLPLHKGGFVGQGQALSLRYNIIFNFYLLPKNFFLKRNRQ